VPGVSIENDQPLSKDIYRIHVRAGHLSFTKIKAMARRGEVPSRLQDCLITDVCRLPVRKSHQETMAHQAQGTGHQSRNNAGRMRISRPTGVKASWVCCSTYLGPIPGGDLCGSPQLAGIRTCSKGFHVKGNPDGKACLQTVRKGERRESKELSRRQRTICG
jgi:hypothetical protein